MNPQFENLGKIIIIGGLALVVIGIILLYSNKIPFLGKLPGDITIKKENFTFYFPIVTSIIISIIISLILYLIRKFQ
ncbi:MAG TPA: DUF2905 domain-containing protein [Cytophagales bacterium]|nr:DUF2905 domain-containing protein [Cytophagales bacterium]